MKHRSKDLRECLALLKALPSNNNMKPEQTSQIEIAIDQVKRLARKKNPSHAEIFACIREVSKRVVRASFKND
jgi:hypothetical protein